MNTPFRPLMIAAALVAAVSVSAQADKGASSGNSKRTQTYKIRTTDKLSIRIFQEDDLSTICRVDAKGTVNLPLGPHKRVAFSPRRPVVTITINKSPPGGFSTGGREKTRGLFELPGGARM